MKATTQKAKCFENKIIWVFYLLWVWNKILDFYFLFWSILVLPIEKIILQSWSSSRNISFPPIPQVVCVHHCINHRKVTFIFNTKNSGSIFWGTVAQVDDQMNSYEEITNIKKENLKNYIITNTSTSSSNSINYNPFSESKTRKVSPQLNTSLHIL